MRCCKECHGHLLAPLYKTNEALPGANCIDVHQMLPCVRRLNWGLRKNREEQEIQDFLTDLQKVGYALNL